MQDFTSLEIVKIQLLELNVQLDRLDSDLQRGRIHLKVNSFIDFRTKLAEAIVAEYQPRVSNDWIHYYADPVNGDIHIRSLTASMRELSNRWRILPVTEFLVDSSHMFFINMDWEKETIPSLDMVKGYLESHGATLNPDGSIPDWVAVKDVISFADNNSLWNESISGAKKSQIKIATKYALENIKDSVLIDIRAMLA
jgi:hypothetical protein